MKFERHIKEKESGEFIYLSSVIELLEVAGFDNELLLMEAMPELAAQLKNTANWFDLLKAGAAKVGIRLKKTESLWTKISKGGTWFEDFIRLVSLYMLTDVTDTKTRKLIKNYAKKHLKSINPKEVASFLLQLDKDLFGITSHLRHFFISVFGVELTTYNKWLDDPKYIQRELEKVKEVAAARNIKSKYIQAIDKLQKQLIDDIKNREIEAEIEKTSKLTENETK